MRVLADAVKNYLVPGSVGFLVLAFLVGVGLLYGSDAARRWGRRWLTVLVVLYWLLSIPLVSDVLVQALTSSVTVSASPVTMTGARAIVVLSTGGSVYRAGGREIAELGKSSAMNVLEGARLFEALRHPWVIVSGGGIVEEGRRTPEAEVLENALVRLGVPRDRILVEDRSRNTREQAVNCAAVVRARSLDPVVLVTSPDHMQRALEAFREAGIRTMPSAADFVPDPPAGLLHRLKPSGATLMQSEWGMYECLARVFYRIEGWFH